MKMDIVVRSKYFKQKQDDKSFKEFFLCFNDCFVIGQRKIVNIVLNKLSVFMIEEIDRVILISLCECIYNDYEVVKEVSIFVMNEVVERIINRYEIDYEIDKEEQNLFVEIFFVFSIFEDVIFFNFIGIYSFCGVVIGKRKFELEENFYKVRQYGLIMLC